MVFISFCSCSKDKEEAHYQIITDDLGRQIKVKENLKRVFSLSPALTEVLFFACPDSLIVARSQACDYPPEALNKSKISTYPFDIESIIAHKPDLIFSEEGITSMEQIKMLEENEISIYMFRYKKVADIFMAIERVGEFCNCKDSVKSKLVALHASLDSISADTLKNIKALGLIWTDPIYVYGRNTLFTDQLNQIGIQNAVDSIFSRPYPELSREYILKINPDLIFGPSYAHLDSTFFINFPELKRIKAYQNRHIFEIDGDILTRPSPRSVDAMKKMKRYMDEI